MTSPSSLKNICILGASGSIGKSTFEVVRQHRDRFRIASVAAASNWEMLVPLVKEFKVEKACMWHPDAALRLSDECGIEVFTGMDGLKELVTHPGSDYIVNGLVGAVGCEPTLEAIRAGKQIGLANKETMVMAGDIINQEISACPGSRIIPIDSEHSAIFQCLNGRPPEEVEALFLTGSGGPFRTLPREKFKDITREEALNHPTWNMGAKITIDSATMMNKGLEVIEAHHLFRKTYDDIRIVIHPGSIIHSMVQFRDGSLMAQMGHPDMQLPILFALAFPERLPLNVGRVDVAELGKLEFHSPDLNKFPGIGLAYRAGRQGGTAPAVLNAANEIAVDLFLHNRISFNRISELVETALSSAAEARNPGLKEILEADQWARTLIKTIILQES